MSGEAPLASLRLECTAYRADQIPPRTVPEVVLAGRSNVGKSSLLNRLAGQKKLARVSSVPGKTVSVNFYRCARPFDFRLVDLPGYGYAKVSFEEKAAWSALVEAYLKGRPVALAVQLADSRRPLTADDRTMLRFFAEQGIPVLIAMTKFDKLNAGERAARTAAFAAETGAEPDRIVPVSARTGEGTDALTRLLLNTLEPDQKS